MAATTTGVRAPRRRRTAPATAPATASAAAETTLEIEVELVEPPGLSYVCRSCDVYGYLAVGQPRLCWCCGTAERLSRR